MEQETPQWKTDADGTSVERTFLGRFDYRAEVAPGVTIFPQGDLWFYARSCALVVRWGNHDDAEVITFLKGESVRSRKEYVHRVALDEAVRRAESRGLLKSCDPVVFSPRVGDWIQTYSGRRFWPLDPRAEEVCIEDIAHALALQCRFAGHCRVHYSIAEHSVRVAARLKSLGLPRQLVLAALLHDASEAYLVDIPRPLKHWSELGALYKKAEERVQLVIEQWAHLPERLTMDPAIKLADRVLLATEARDLMKLEPNSWSEMPPPLPQRIEPWSWKHAEEEFLYEFNAAR